MSADLLVTHTQVNPVLIDRRRTILNVNRDIYISAGLHGAGPTNHGVLRYFAVLVWTGPAYRYLYGTSLDWIGISRSAWDRFGRERDLIF